MFEVEIDDVLKEKLTKTFEKMPKIAKKSLSESLKKAIREFRKSNIEKIKENYSIDDFYIKAGSFKISAKNGEGTLAASTKKTGIEHFSISQKYPGRPKERIKATIKSSKTTEMSTMFWAFYKKPGKRFTVGLFFRNRESNERHITMAKTASLFGMSREPTKEELHKMEELFLKNLRAEMTQIWES
ncbi:hypothetical protein [Fusobacterium hominis]|uniref:Phage protein n=1 Tax=Fusobacterium hominis TaxID=2764326 RepID=A0A7G9GXI1_9FUSO|nr:hypothetical protein [Fusobacterium hominis]QNM15513.1 hypothetical protein H9Q81_01340 [Fusobacterium hominis]